VQRPATCAAASQVSGQQPGRQSRHVNGQQPPRQTTASNPYVNSPRGKRVCSGLNICI
jgi:hypothetical protein